MEVKLGTTLTIQGRDYTCFEIIHSQVTQIAQEDSESYKQHHRSRWPLEYHIAQEIEDFAVGDVIHTEYERLQFFVGSRVGMQPEEPNCLVIFTHWKTKKEKADGIEGPESGVGQAASSDVEGTGDGDPSVEGAGAQSLSEDGSPLHGPRSSGEGGAAGGSRVGQKGEHSIA